MTDETERLLAERGRTHGEYTEHAEVTQGIMRILEASRNWPTLPDIVRETLHMWAHKTGRVVTGNPFLHDHYDDVAGYARLITQRTIDKVGLKPEHDPGPPSASHVWQRVDLYSLVARETGVSRTVAKTRLLAAACGLRPATPPEPSSPADDELFGRLLDLAIWMSGSSDFGDGGTARQGWLSMRGTEVLAEASRRRYAAGHIPGVSDEQATELGLGPRAASHTPGISDVLAAELGLGHPGTPEDGGHHATSSGTDGEPAS